MPLKIWSPPLALWAARDLMRQPFFAAMLFVTLTLVTALASTLLLLHQTLTTASLRLLEQAPHVVVRRIGAGGWLPLPAAEALHRVAEVPGVIRPRARVWGVVQGPDGPVTLVADGETAAMSLPVGWPHPKRGQALVGPGVLPPDSEQERLTLVGRRSMILEVIGRMPRDGSMAIHDVVVAHIDDARALLGLESGQASDLALDVFHDDEAQALLPDLAAAFDWPVQMTTRLEQQGRHLAHISRVTGLACLAFVPLLLSVACVVMAAGIWGHRPRETGLLRAVGWTGADLLRLHLYRGSLVGIPAMALGVLSAYLLLFQAGMTWAAQLLFGWNGPPPALYLTPLGSAGAWLLAVLLTGVPFLAAVFWTGWRSATTDPAVGIEGGR